MSKYSTALQAIILFFIGIIFVLPNEANIGIMILEAFNGALCNGDLAGSNVMCEQMGYYIFMIKILGFTIIIADIVYIIDQVKKGNLI